MTLPAGDDHWHALRPQPANCSPAIMMAFGRDTSFSMHSFTMRRAMRFVDATRGRSAIDSSVVRGEMMPRVLIMVASRVAELPGYKVAQVLSDLIDSATAFRSSPAALPAAPARLARWPVARSS